MMALALLPLSAALWLGLGDQLWWPLAFLLAMSLLTVAAYAWDKRQAVRGQWRVSRIPASSAGAVRRLARRPAGPPVAAPQDPEAQLPAGILADRAAASDPVGALDGPPALAAIAACVTGLWIGRPLWQQ